MSVDPPEQGETSAAEEWRRFAETGAFLMGGGVQMVAGGALGFFVGRWIDTKAGTKPAFTALVALVGLAGGVLQMWRAIQALQRRQEKRSRP